MKYFVRILVLLLLFSFKSNILKSQTDFQQYNEARKLTYLKKWDEAIKSYEKIIKNTPNSRYVDDSYFWKGYVLEKSSKLVKAYECYQKLQMKFPDSPWVDDAIIHQIILAEYFIKNGKMNYLPYLLSNLNHEESNIRYQAAMSLGKLGQKESLPVLDEIINNGDDDLKKLALSIKENIHNIIITKNELEELNDMEILQNAIEENGFKEDNKNNFWRKLFYETDYYKRYHQLNKKDQEWTEIELINYGLWHIIPEDQFSRYMSLDQFTDKREWLRKFWKKWDPTPTTPENERQEEFMRRIKHARKYFGDEWNFKQTEYLTEQYLRTGWSVAPWDSRGELYIKYGEPDFRDSNVGYLKEHWVYYRYNFDFIVNKYITNIFGNGLSIGPLAKVSHKDDLAYFQSEVILKKDFKFNVYKDFNPIKNFKLMINVEDSIPSVKLVNVSFLLSGDDLKFKKIEGKYRAKYKQSYVVLNENLDEVIKKQKDYVLITESKDETKQENNFKNSFKFTIEPGFYTLAIRIEDLNSDKLGIFIKEFDVGQ